eukprot:6481233-Amphidinium_carterae.1
MQQNGWYPSKYNRRYTDYSVEINQRSTSAAADAQHQHVHANQEHLGQHQVITLQPNTRRVASITPHRLFDSVIKRPSISQ